MEHNDFDVLSINVADKFGDSGLTGVIVLKKQPSKLEVDSFLMSCRVLGRGIEKTIWSDIFSFYKNQGFEFASGQYLRTPKNDQVANFFDSVGFEVKDAGESVKTYICRIDDIIKSAKQSGIEVNFDESGK